MLVFTYCSSLSKATSASSSNLLKPCARVSPHVTLVIGEIHLWYPGKEKLHDPDMQEEEGEGESEGPAPAEQDLVQEEEEDRQQAAAAGTALPSDDDNFEEEDEDAVS